jgi:hypothetical protein
MVPGHHLGGGCECGLAGVWACESAPSLISRAKPLCADNAQVSDVYVKLGNGFEHCVNAFHRVGISTR